MKEHRLLFSVGVFFAFSTGLVSAAPSKPTPSAGSPSAAISAAQRSQVHWINSRVRNQHLLLLKGYKAGKFSKDQAKTLFASLKAVRVQEVAFFRQNGRHELTAGQLSQLSGSLDQNSAVLGETPSPAPSN